MMIKRVIILIAFFLVALFQPAGLLANTQVIDGDDLENLFFDLVTREAPWSVNDLEISNFYANPTILYLPAGPVEFRLLNQPHNNFLGKKKLEIAAFIDGQQQARVTLIGRIKLMADVVVTTKRMARHQVVTEEDVKVMRMDITQMAEDVLREPGPAVGQRLKRSMQAGAPLFTDLLEQKPLVKRGDRVLIEAKSGAIVVTVPGEVRSTGARGDEVRVKNLMSRREVYAQVIDEKTVRVTF